MPDALHCTSAMEQASAISGRIDGAAKGAR
jgi:hypothetical protein